jgi:cell division protein FtsZ
MYEVSEAAKIITESVDPEAKIIFGAVLDDRLKESLKITVVATGFDEKVTKDSLLKVKHEPINYFQAPVRNEEPEVSFGVPGMKKDYHAAAPAPAPAPAASTMPSRMSMPSRSITPPEPPARDQMPQSINSNNASNSSLGSDDEDLEIPAFIRKKMM